MQHPCHDPSKDVAMRSAMRLMNDDIDIIYRTIYMTESVEGN